jgi:hypothetical protein
VLGLVLIGSGRQTRGQITTPDPSFGSSAQFRTDNGINIFTGGANYAKNNGSAVGYSSDPVWTAQPFLNSQTVATAQTIYNPLVYSGSSFAAGDYFQLGVHAISQRDGGAADPVTIYASLYKYDPGAPAGNIPIVVGSPIIANLAITIANSTGDALYYSQKVQLQDGGLQNGGQYVLAFAPKAVPGAAPANWAIVNRRLYSLTGLPTDAATQNLFTTVYRTDNNSVAGSGLAGAIQESFTGPFGYRIYAAAVPEPGIVALFAGASLSGWSFVLRRRTSRR